MMTKGNVVFAFGVFSLSTLAGCADEQRQFSAMTSLPELVQVCSVEARSDHALLGPRSSALRSAVTAHKSRMAEICESWRTADRSTKMELLGRCEAEAGGGPRNVNEPLLLSEEHAARMRGICRALADRI